MDIFYALASLNDREEIDLSQFIESLCLMGIHIFTNVKDLKMKVGV